MKAVSAYGARGVVLVNQVGFERIDKEEKSAVDKSEKQQQNCPENRLKLQGTQYRMSPYNKT